MSGRPPSYSPEMRLELAGGAAAAELRGSLTSVTYQGGLEGADRLEILLANENLRWLDHPSLRIDTAVALSLGYVPDPPRRVFAGDIVATNATFPSGTMPTLRVVAQDRRTRLQRSSAVRWFAIPTKSLGVLPIPDPAIAGEVALEHGLLPMLDPVGAALAVMVGGVDLVVSFADPDAPQRTVRKQHDQSDYDFLAQISKENGWEMVIDHGADPAGSLLRFFSPMSRRDADLTLRYGRSLLSFSPRLSEVGQIAAVSVKVWRPEIRLELTVTVSWDWDRMALDVQITPGFGGGTGGTKKGRRAITLVREPVTLGSAARLIVGKLIPSLNKRLTASGSAVGDPRIRAGAVLRIEGVGETYGGLYRVTSVTHTIDGGGYRTDFDLRKEIWFGSIPPISQGAVRVNQVRLPLPSPMPAGKA